MQYGAESSTSAVSIKITIMMDEGHGDTRHIMAILLIQSTKEIAQVRVFCMFRSRKKIFELFERAAGALNYFNFELFLNPAIFFA